MATVTRQGGPVAPLKVRRATAPAIANQPSGERVTPGTHPIVPAAEPLHDVASVLEQPVGKAKEVGTARLPSTARMAGLLVAAMDAAVPSGAAATQETVPGLVPPGKATNTVRDPSILIAAAPEPSSATSGSPNTLAGAVRPPRHAPLEAMAVPSGLATLIGPTPFSP